MGKNVGGMANSKDFNYRLILFVIYSILYEFIVWGIFGSAVFLLGHSGWWILVAILVSGAQLGPTAFGLYTKYESED